MDEMMGWHGMLNQLIYIMIMTMTMTMSKQAVYLHTYSSTYLFGDIYKPTTK